MHSIRVKSTAITIAAVLTAVCCVFFASFSIIRSEADQRSVEMMGLVAKDARKSLEKYTNGIEQSMEMLSNLAVDTLDGVMLAQGGVIGADTSRSTRTEEQDKQLDAYLAEYTDGIRTNFETVAAHTNGAITYYYCISPGVSTNEHGFFYSRVGKTGFYEREPLDARKLDPSDKDHTTWYYKPIKRGSPTWVGPYSARSLNDMLVCSYVVPIYKSGTLIGVLGMDIPLETLTSLVSSISVYQTGFACLLDTDSHVLYHPTLTQGATMNLPVDKSVLQQEDSADVLIRYNYVGKEQQVSFTTLDTGMKLVIVAPTEEVYASTGRLISVIPPLAAIVVIVFATLSYLALRHITRPLLSLTAASRRLANADYDVELNYHGHDEVGELTTAFEVMRTRLESYIEDLNLKARTDDLTHLPNQRYFFELATAARQQMLDAEKRPVMLYLNLVGMKHYNRQFGFGEGDHLICDIARILSSRFGKLRVSRFGQDHFAAVSEEDHLEERLYDLFDACQTANGGRSLPVSVGIYQNSMGEVDVSVACDRAKFACDVRRGTYYSGYRYFDATMMRKVDTFHYVINNLDQALRNKWVEVHYQPIIRSVNGKVCDEEALSRWVDPVVGRLSPGDFIPSLEDAGLIYKLDLYVLDQVLEKIQAQRESGLTVVPHSINLSRSDFDSLDIVEEIRRRVDAAGIEHSLITIEITESIIGSDFAFMKEQVERFQALGFPVWMDDFGSGYSSLDFLQSIQFDLLKFDMSFLRKLDEGKSGKIILTELMQMAIALGVDTLCEGVETEAQVRFLREIGCSKLQGYYYCKAIPLSEIIERNNKGIQIGYENLNESSYYEAVAKVNLHDLTAIAQKNEDSLHDIFNTLPMGVMEIVGDDGEFVRTNQAYRDFAKRYFDYDFSAPAHGRATTNSDAKARFVQRVKESCTDDGRVFMDDRMPSGKVVRYLIRRIGSNPVNGAIAVAIAVLSIGESVG